MLHIKRDRTGIKRDRTGRGGFGTIHYARRIDRPIDEWGILKIKMKLSRSGIKKMSFHLKTYIRSYNILIRFYRITQEPETHSYMMVLYYAADGNLREYLKINFNNFNWEQKLDNSFFLKISDFGLSKLMEENPNNTEKKNIFGVFPYIAPEVLSGEKKYIKAADVYSFGFIFYEIVTGFPPYPDIPHYKDLAMKI
ncbi:hypothetical protein Glove_92g77 [Diversispora epigaea]|uniref:Protein kinase domain-containing protein n=1 Tax=Diversispora epigaea TaxID=1348612 RepID=A0A397J9N4_9GLOM|nr:hypothetical protein Glove_92g77 [Diversispora epigaea]